MKVKVLLFAQHCEAVGKKEIEVDLGKIDKITAGELYQRLAREYPKLKKLAKVTLAVVNNDMVNARALVKDGDEVAFFPPMGGA
ncbi:MAG: MoaD/ThiS family protein [Dehalococcoidia bacterium]|nr:MoaD/ThiS family protein [Dehalococcoidia bacterium]